MKTFKRIGIFIGILLIAFCFLIGFKFGNKYYSSYQNEKELSNTILDKEIHDIDLHRAQKLKSGQILLKERINLSEIPPIWNKISENNSLITDFEYLEQINFFLIVYKSDSILVNGIIAEPKRDGNFPVIIFNRGGNKEIGKMAKAKTLFTLVESSSKLVNEGYVAIASCYRENDEFGGNDIKDVLNLIETSKEIEKADTSRIGMFGWSRGGMMTYLTLKHSDKIKTAVIGNGPTDLQALINDRPEMETRVYAKLIPDYTRKKEEELRKRSVIYWADELDKSASLLILCGTEDEQVNPNQADKIANKLTQINYDFTLKKFNTDHKFSTKAHERDAILIDWFSENL